MSALLEVRGLRKRFRSGDAGWLDVLNGVDWSLERGEVAAIVGASGAGKSTLLHLAVGLLQPSAGEVRVLGRDPRDPGTLAHVGFVAQDKPLYGHFTVAETLRMGGWLNPAWDHRLAEKRVARLDLPLTQKVGRLSGGQRSQLALAVALGKRPELLLVDEPVSDLDPLARRDFFRVLMEEVAESGMTVVLSSHVLADLERTCEHLVLLSRSRVQFAGDTDELLARHRMLTGPRDGAAAIDAAHTVVKADYTERQASLLIRANGPVDVTGWQVRNVSLEDLVLAYMAAPHLIDDTIATSKKEQVLS